MKLNLVYIFIGENRILSQIIFLFETAFSLNGSVYIIIMIDASSSSLNVERILVNLRDLAIAKQIK